MVVIFRVCHCENYVSVFSVQNCSSLKTNFMWSSETLGASSSSVAAAVVVVVQMSL